MAPAPSVGVSLTPPPLRPGCRDCRRSTDSRRSTIAAQCRGLAAAGIIAGAGTACQMRADHRSSASSDAPVLEWSGQRSRARAPSIRSRPGSGGQPGSRPCRGRSGRAPTASDSRPTVHLPEPRREEAESLDVILSDGLGVRNVVRDPQPSVVERTDEPLRLDRRDRRLGCSSRQDQLIRPLGVREQRLHALHEPALTLSARGWIGPRRGPGPRRRRGRRARPPAQWLRRRARRAYLRTSGSARRFRSSAGKFEGVDADAVLGERWRKHRRALADSSAGEQCPGRG